MGTTRAKVGRRWRAFSCDATAEAMVDFPEPGGPASAITVRL
jgi:hypothetical protein